MAEIPKKSRIENIQSDVKQSKDVLGHLVSSLQHLKSSEQGSSIEGPAQQLSDPKDFLRQIHGPLDAAAKQKEHQNDQGINFKSILQKRQGSGIDSNDGYLNEYVDLTRKLLKLRSEDDEWIPYSQAILAEALKNRFTAFGRQDDLTEALKWGRIAVSGPSKSDQDLPKRLNIFSNCLWREYERTDDTAVLEEAIEHMKNAIDKTPENDNLTCHTRRCELAMLKALRLERLNNIVDFEGVSAPGDSSVQLQPGNYEARAERLRQLHSQLRFPENGDPVEDLKKDIQLVEKTIDLRQKSHPNDRNAIAILYDFLGQLYQHLHEWGRDETQLDNSIRALEEAINLVDPHGDVYPKLQHSLGLQLHQKYLLLDARNNESEPQNKLNHLDRAITAGKEAIKMKTTHPARAIFLFNLGRFFHNRATQTKSAEDSNRAFQYWVEAWKCEAAPWKPRVLAAARCIVFMSHCKRVNAAAKLAMDVVDVLPDIDLHCLNNQDRQFVIMNFFDITADGCAAFLACDDIKNALEIVEKGRAVILRDLMNTQSELFARGPDGSAAAELQSPAIGPNTKGKCPIYGEPIDSMMACASEGAIIIVNVAESRSDAIIVSSTAIKTLNLPKLSMKKARSWLSQNWYEGETYRHDDFLKYLEWLWTSCVKDVLDFLDPLHAKIDGELPRVWWIGSGCGSQMPFHAAGIHKKRSTELALTRVISSYSSSMGVLRYARGRACRRAPGETKVLTVTMSSTPDKANLEIDGERDAISRATTKQIVKPQPNADEVLKELVTCDVAHFACHGESDPVNPMQSAILLQKKDASGKLVQDPLTMEDISRNNLKQAWIAYLSACETAENKVFQLADEALHVGSGFQVAGFPHVICCLWPADNLTCNKLAEKFYERLFEYPESVIGGREIASMLQKSVTDHYYEGLSWRLPLFWAPFVHFGA